MAHLLIAAANERYRRTLTGLLGAAGHHIVSTSDAGLARAALALNECPIIALLADSDLDESSMVDVAVFAAQTQRDADDPGHAFILLTDRPGSALSPSVRTLLTSCQIAILRHDCSIAALLTAVEAAAEYLALSGHASMWRARSAMVLDAPCASM